MKEFSDFEAAHRREHNLLAGTEHPRNKFEHQMILAQELFVRDNPSETMNIDENNFRNRVMDYWVDKTYAEAFGELIAHPNFKRHSRLNGDVFTVTLSDVEYFLHNNKLPEQ